MQTTGATIVEPFADYYENLYASKTDMSAEVCKDFLRDIQLQELQKDDRDALEVEMMEEEVTLALRDLQMGKAAVLNGIPVKLYKGMATVIASPLPEMHKEARDKGCLPADQRAATITVKYKEGKPSRGVQETDSGNASLGWLWVVEPKYDMHLRLAYASVGLYDDDCGFKWWADYYVELVLFIFVNPFDVVLFIEENRVGYQIS
ncbi:hypothetical protein NDU88_005707 [Pleurodeles waltl]|uniref:Uncharacterized protein n=1 Tax=Pleurodeles waltl TaxID=8319 RepID=A0AAV7PHL1_PLEWA|nr:hypothetical protein NDU88_005707 [Pleurodeles waltl]